MFVLHREKIFLLIVRNKKNHDLFFPQSLLRIHNISCDDTSSENEMVVYLFIPICGMGVQY